MDGVYELVVQWFPVVFGLWFGLPAAVLAVKVWRVPGRREMALTAWAEKRPGEVPPRGLVLLGTAAASLGQALRAILFGTLAALVMRAVFVVGSWLGAHVAVVFACAWGFAPCGGV